MTIACVIIFARADAVVVVAAAVSHHSHARACIFFTAVNIPLTKHMRARKHTHAHTRASNGNNLSAKAHAIRA